MLTRRQALMGTAAAGVLAAMPTLTAEAMAKEAASLPRKKVDLVAPPFVHAHEQVATTGPQVVEFKLTVHEKPLIVDDEGTELQAMTYNGSIPGPLMVVHQDDYVELTLINPETNTLEHNIDFHASTGALGGGGLTHVQPGEQVKLRFKANASRHLRLPLRPRRPHDPVARGLRHAGRHHGAARATD